MDWRKWIVVGTMLTMVLSPTDMNAQDPGTPHRAGFESSRITDSARSRPIQIDVWYPTAAEEAEHSYGLSTGRVALDAPLASGRFPVVLLTHGALGAATNYSWISEHLARSGFVVVGVSHFGESPVFGQSTLDPATVSHFGARTRDLSFALDFALTRSKWFKRGGARQRLPLPGRFIEWLRRRTSSWRRTSARDRAARSRRGSRLR